MKTLQLLTLTLLLCLGANAQAGHNRNDHHRNYRSGHDYRHHDYGRHNYRDRFHPPPHRYELRGHRPRYDWIWTDGYWTWGYNDWSWTPGYWAAPRVIVTHPYSVYEPAPTFNDGTTSGIILGGTLGGIIGHQSRKTAAGIAIGAVAGAIIGNQIEKNNAEIATQKTEAREAELLQTGQNTTDQEVAEAEARARAAELKLAQARQNAASAKNRAAALEKAKAEEATAEAELRKLNK